jgi:hypothetical protein
MWPRNLWPESNFLAAPRTSFPASKFRGGAVTNFRARRRSRQSVFASVLTRCSLIFVLNGSVERPALTIA